jgi:hypothetical protein
LRIIWRAQFRETTRERLHNRLNAANARCKVV